MIATGRGVHRRRPCRITEPDRRPSGSPLLGSSDEGRTVMMPPGFASRRLRRPWAGDSAPDHRDRRFLTVLTRFQPHARNRGTVRFQGRAVQRGNGDPPRPQSVSPRFPRRSSGDHARRGIARRRDRESHAFSIPIYPAPANLAIVPAEPAVRTGWQPRSFTLLLDRGDARWARLLGVRDWRCFATCARLLAIPVRTRSRRGRAAAPARCRRSHGDGARSCGRRRSRSPRSSWRSCFPGRLRCGCW